MDLVTALIVGIMQGLFEWLPISSQGNIMGLFLAFFQTSPEEALKIAVLLHTGTLVAAAVYFRKELRQMISFKTKEDQELTKFIIIATLATAITAIPLFFLLKQALSFEIAYVILFIALLLFSTGVLQLKKKSVGKMKLTKMNAFLTGLGQGFSVLPGVSRSGITTSVLLFRDSNPEQAFKISFIMSIPAVLLAELGFGLMEGIYLQGFAVLALIVSFIVGLLSIDVLIKLAKKINFSYFCFALAVLYLLIFMAMIFG